MYISEQSQILQHIRGRHDAIVESWYNAIIPTGFTSLGLAETRRNLSKLAEKLIELLCSEAPERSEAQAIGSELAGMHYLRPETLARAQEVLASRFVSDLREDQISALQPRLALVLAEVGAGFVQQTLDTILLEQEQIKSALLSAREQAEDALRKSEASLAEAQRIAHLGHWEFDWVHNRLHWSDEIHQIFGVSEQEFGGTFEDFLARVHPQDIATIVEATEEAGRRETVSVEHRIVRPTGEVRVVHQRVHFVFDEDQLASEIYPDEPDAKDETEASQAFLALLLRMASSQQRGRPVRVVGTVQDITERQRTEQALREAEERFRSSFENAPIGMALLSLDRRYLQVNRALCEMLGYAEKELLATTSPEITHPEDLEISRTHVEWILNEKAPKYDLEKRYVSAEGHVVWVLLNVSLVRDAEGNPSHFIAQYQDITERKSLEKQLEHQAFHDPLTDLPNRALFLDRLNQALVRKNGREGVVQVLFIDLDNFKLINDSLGHSAGDNLLVQAAARLKACVRAQDTVARFGGDEFTFLVENATGTAENAALVAERIIERLKDPFLVKDHEVFLTASIGIASSTGEEVGENLLRDADTAMYRAKQTGKSGYKVFDPNMTVEALEQLELASQLRRAVEREELVLCYQPKVELASGRVAGMEALLRWDSADGRLILPDVLIPLAEETGLMVSLGKRIAEEAARRARLWQEQYPHDPPLVMNINLSLSQLQHPTRVQELVRALKESGADLSSLELEITENVLMKHEGDLSDALAALKSLGVRLAIDDFGTGYSSLSHLYRLPVDALKIDRSFVERIGKDPRARLITSATISLAKTLGLEVVAEGIETAEQLKELRELGCTLGQGYYLAEPMTSEEASALIEEGSLLKLG